jgi:hypothetical protein
MAQKKRIEKRVVLIYWKHEQKKQMEVFSNLKNLCLSYPQFNYNTMNNYLSKKKSAYENEQVRIERKEVYSRPLNLSKNSHLNIMQVVAKKQLKDFDEKQDDLYYWLQQPPNKRLSAVTSIISQSLKRGQRMNKSILHIKKYI